ncbi:MAG TPA: polysaccharide biosynthesis C-terminal domain-containing protein [Solirubrobacterales bacterium]|jgi:O-antigen/teichoic acid export membrane protein
MSRLGAALARARGAPAALIVRVLGRGLALVAAVVLARLLGVEGYAAYAYAMALVAVLNVPAVLGFDGLVLREVAVYARRKRGDLILRLLRYAYRNVLPMGVAVAAGGAAFVALAAEPGYALPALLALSIVPLRSLTAVRSAVLQGLRRPELGFAPLFVIFPGTLVVLAGGALLLDVEVSPEAAVGMAILAWAVALGVAWLASARYLRPLIRGAAVAATNAPHWRRSLTAFTAVALLTAFASSIGLIALGQLAEPADVAVFQVAMRLAEPVGFIFSAITVANAPLLAQLHDAGDREELGRTARRASRASLYYSLPLAAVLLLAHEWLFGLFGPGFEGSAGLLALLIGGLLFNALAGSVGNVLLMTGAASTVAKAKGLALTVDLGLCVALIPSLGATGAAIARCADFVVWNSILIVAVRRRLGFNATAIALPARRAGRT